MEFCYRCSLCGRSFSIQPLLSLCPDCTKQQPKDQPLHGVLEVDGPRVAGYTIDLFYP